MHHIRKSNLGPLPVADIAPFVPTWYVRMVLPSLHEGFASCELDSCLKSPEKEFRTIFTRVYLPAKCD